MLDLPQSAGKVHVVGVGIVKALHFIPKQSDLLKAIGADLLGGGAGVDQFSALINGNQ